MFSQDPNLLLPSPQPFALAVVVTFTLLGGIAVLFMLARFSNLPARVPVAVVCVHLAVGLTTYLLLGPFSMSPDGQVYDSQAVKVAGLFGLESPAYYQEPLHSGKIGFPILLGLAYAVVGHEPFVGIALNSFSTGVTALVILATTRKAFGSYSPWLVVIFLAAAPSFVTLGPTVMREALCWLGIALLLYMTVSLQNGQALLRGIAAGTLGLGLLLFVRTGLGVLMTAAIIVGFLASLLWTRFGTKTLMSYLAVGLIGVLAIGDVVLEVAGYSNSYVVDNRDFSSVGATTGYSVWLGPLEPFGIPGYMIAALPKIVLGPFPWELEPKLVWAWVFANVIFWWASLAMVTRGIIWQGLSRQVVGLLVTWLVVLVALAAFMSSYGLLSRMRSFPMLVLLVLVGGFASAGRQKKREGHAQ